MPIRSPIYPGAAVVGDVYTAAEVNALPGAGLP
jgi:hypothetical protein